MSKEIEATRSRPPILRRAAAGLILIAVVALVIHIAIGLIIGVFWVFAVLAAVVAVIWAMRNI